MRKSNFGFAIFFGYVEADLSAVPFGFVLNEIKTAVGNQPNNFFTRQHFHQFVLAVMMGWVAVSKFVIELPSISPVHQPRTLLMASYACCGFWSTKNETLKSLLFMALLI